MGKTIHFRLDPKHPPKMSKKEKKMWRRLDRMTEEEVHAAALSDPDAQPLTEEAFEFCVTAIGKHVDCLAEEMLAPHPLLTQLRERADAARKSGKDDQ